MTKETLQDTLKMKMEAYYEATTPEEANAINQEINNLIDTLREMRIEEKQGELDKATDINEINRLLAELNELYMAR